MAPSWLSAALTALLLSCFIDGTSASMNLRKPASPNYRSRSDKCPPSCVTVGYDPANWPVYHSLQELKYCTETVFYHVSLYDMVDVSGSPHRLYACTSYGSFTAGDNTTINAAVQTVQTVSNATYTVGHWDDNAPDGVDLRRMSKQMRLQLAAGYTTGQGALTLFAQSKTSTAGLYVGNAVQTADTVTAALSSLEDLLTTTNNTGGTVALELCGDAYDQNHVIGFIATSNTSFTPVQQVMQQWSQATCIDFNSTESFVGTAVFTSPLLSISNSTLSNSTSINSTQSSTRSLRIRGSSHTFLLPRDDCTTIQVVSGDTCATLASSCGISASDFTTYNPSSTLCSSLVPGQHVCCSSGTLPDYAPSTNDDGSCYSYNVLSGDTCSALAATYDLTIDEIDGFNNYTWGWNGCDDLLLGAVICLSDGTPPMPAALTNAECGPQVPGTLEPADGTYNLSGLNPCPLNACCDIWGQCGITEEFCVDTSTGAPGTAANGTNGCISNCGTDVVQGDAPSEFISLAYYEGYGMDRSCLYQDISQLDVSSLTHLHFAFGVLDSNYNITVGSAASTYEFDSFVRLGSAVHRVLSFGGWAFSTDASTYSIFRDGTTEANRVAMATSIANFINEYDLDGVDIDWEYPGEPDIPGIPAGSDDDGANYLAFLVELKNLLPDKTVSIAAPASYWYLKAFPIANISEVVDYIVYMTYDLHGQWDAGNQYSQDGCTGGNCLRSHVNLTETMTALAMITKAGVPSGKVVVGVSSYGRSFGMSDSGCYTAECTFTGTSSSSGASPGLCTDTAGYISDAEIEEIISGNTSSVTKRTSSRVNQYYLDEDSDSQILVYDDTQWVAFMTSDIRSSRASKYQGLSLGGTTNWASDLETYNEAPGSLATWSQFLTAISDGVNPMTQKATSGVTGNWTTLSCDDPAVSNVKTLTPEERWDEMDCPDAWANVISVWTDSDNGTGITLTASISASINGPELANCGSLADTNNCDTTLVCKIFEETDGSGPAGYEIWNSMVYVHEMYATFYNGIVQAAALSLDPSYDEFESTFAPVSTSDDWIDVLLIFVNLFGTVAVSAFFNSVLKTMPFFRGGSLYDNLKDTGKALVSFSVSMADYYLPSSEGEWSAESQVAFSAYLGQVVNFWANSTAYTLAALFNGDADTLSVLTDLISDGKMIEGSVNGSAAYPDMSDTTEIITTIQTSIELAFYSYAIPAAWSASGASAFVLDTGADCSDLSVADQFVDESIQEESSVCYNDRLYFLVAIPGDYPCKVARSCLTAPTFDIPAGLDDLDGSKWGGITVTDLVTGSVRTYAENGNENGGAAADPTNSGTLDDLYDQDITTPGYIRLPVCSGELAFGNWEDNYDVTLENWPCYVAPSPDDCQASSFVDETSDASPTVDDCMQIVNNIINTDGEWTTQVVGENQRRLVQYGSCSFGIEATNEHGNVNFKVGAQDIVDIIEEAISLFGGNGQIGAKGYMDCSGNVNDQDTLWGIY